MSDIGRIHREYYSPPDYDDYPCEVCGEFEDNCICPECPVCGNVGYPGCYRDHGKRNLKRSEIQKFYLECNQREWAEEARLENFYWDQYEKSLKDEVEWWRMVWL